MYLKSLRDLQATLKCKIRIIMVSTVDSSGDDYRFMGNHPQKKSDSAVRSTYIKDAAHTAGKT